jgi:serine/threonine protein kinase
MCLGSFVQPAHRLIQKSPCSNECGQTVTDNKELCTGQLYIVMEYAEGGDLASMIRSRAKERRYFAEDHILFMFVQLCLALWHVHSQNFMHRDLKTQNIFVAKRNILKLGDFGTARMLSSIGDMASTIVGTPYYLSPGATPTRFNCALCEKFSYPP